MSTRFCDIERTARSIGQSILRMRKGIEKKGGISMLSREAIPGFALNKPPKGFPELDAELIWNVFDLAASYGDNHPQERVRAVASHVTTSFGVVHLVAKISLVRKAPPYLEVHQYKPGVTGTYTRLVSALNQGILTVDDRVNARQLTQFVKGLDKIGDRNGWRPKDFQCGGRHLVNELVSMPRFLVAEMFTKPKASHHVPPGGKPEWIINQYDHPEELRAVREPFMGTLICHERDEAEFKEFERNFFQAVQDLGLRTGDDVIRFMNSPEGPKTLAARVNAIRQRIRN